MVRRTEWGNWGILFYEKNNPNDYASSKIHGRLNFPVGTRGPVDGFIGSPEHKRYTEIIKAYMTDGTLPEGLTKVGN